MRHWIWQHDNWPQFTWDDTQVFPRLRGLHRKLGMLLGQFNGAISEEQTLDTLLANILPSSAIEDERLNAPSIRSSLAKRLGITQSQPYPISDRSEGVASVMLDAITHSQQPLTLDQLFQWHHWLFPETSWPLQNLNIGALRGHEPMQVVSGRIDRPVVHFEAPPRDRLEHELSLFLDWFNRIESDPLLDPLLRAAITHLWFVTLHPFDDGNGRITRALTDLALSQADHQSIRLYAMSSAILDNRAAYYRILEQTQKGSLEVTPWLTWFLDTLEVTLDSAINTTARIQAKTRFWHRHRETPLFPEQSKILNRLLDGGEAGFTEGISASQYQKVAKVSKATATRHLADLVEKRCLVKLPGGGRSSRYQIAWETTDLSANK